MKKKIVKDDQEIYKATLFAPTYVVHENVVIIKINSETVVASYRRKGSSLKDIEYIPIREIVAIVKGKGAEGVIVRSAGSMPIMKALKITGTVRECDNGLLKIISADGTINYVNPNFSRIIRPDEAVNKDMPKRGRKPKIKKEKERERKPKETKPTVRIMQPSPSKVTENDDWDS